MRSIVDPTSRPQRPSCRCPRSSRELSHPYLMMRIQFAARELPAFACHNPHDPRIGSEEAECHSNYFELSHPPTHSGNASDECAPPCSSENVVAPRNPTAPFFPL